MLSLGSPRGHLGKSGIERSEKEAYHGWKSAHCGRGLPHMGNLGSGGWLLFPFPGSYPQLKFGWSSKLSDPARLGLGSRLGSQELEGRIWSLSAKRRKTRMKVKTILLFLLMLFVMVAGCGVPSIMGLLEILGHRSPGCMVFLIWCFWHSGVQGWGRDQSREPFLLHPASESVWQSRKGPVESPMPCVQHPWGIPHPNWWSTLICFIIVPSIQIPDFPMTLVYSFFLPG